jgi:hypothetical protein
MSLKKINNTTLCFFFTTTLLIKQPRQKCVNGIFTPTHPLDGLANKLVTNLSQTCHKLVTKHLYIKLDL